MCSLHGNYKLAVPIAQRWLTAEPKRGRNTRHRLLQCSVIVFYGSYHVMLAECFTRCFRTALWCALHTSAIRRGILLTAGEEKSEKKKKLEDMHERKSLFNCSKVTPESRGDGYFWLNFQEQKFWKEKFRYFLKLFLLLQE